MQHNEEYVKNLVRNCQHFGCHQTLLLSNKEGTKIGVEKRTFESAGVHDLIREVEGIKWYCDQVGVNAQEAIRSFVNRQKSCSLILKYHQGQVDTFSSDVDLLMDRIEEAVCHYLDVFKSCNFKYAHGDYFLGNIVFHKDRVKWVIDWEHFNDQLPSGYDPINCIVEAFLTSFEKRGPCSNATSEVAKKLLEKISKEIALPGYALRSPTVWCRRVVEENSEIWGVQYKKLPQVWYSEERCGEIDKIIGI